MAISVAYELLVAACTQRTVLHNKMRQSLGGQGQNPSIPPAGLKRSTALRSLASRALVGAVEAAILSAAMG